MDIAEEVQHLFERRGDSQYGGEAVTQLEHALQCAQLASVANAGPSQVIAALLHDVGHLLHSLPADAPDDGVDDSHESRGQVYLQKYFDAAVTEPIRLHVDAKRYLCTVDDSYASRLSQPSLVSMNLQGGLMSEKERLNFEASRFFREAVELRRWDDAAEVVNLSVKPLQHYLPLFREVEAH